MHKMVDTLRKQKMSHDSAIERLTLKELREKVSRNTQPMLILLFLQNRKCYVPRKRTKEELLSEVGYKKSWKGSGNQNTYFMEPPIMKPKILDPWTMARVQQPARAYEKFFASKQNFITLNHSLFIIYSDSGGQRPFAFTDKNSEEFGAASETDGVSTRYAEILAEQKKKYQDWVMCPSKYEPELKEPLCM